MAQRDQQRERNKPNKPMLHRAGRHNLDSLAGIVKDKNTLVPRSMYETVNEDLRAIRRGDGRKLPNNRYEYRGRIYAWDEPDGYYPVSGPGLIETDRDVFKALLVFKRKMGINDESLRHLANDPYCPERAVELAMDVWQGRTNLGSRSVPIDKARILWRSMPKEPRKEKDK